MQEITYSYHDKQYTLLVILGNNPRRISGKEYSDVSKPKVNSIPELNTKKCSKHIRNIPVPEVELIYRFGVVILFRACSRATPYEKSN